MSQTKAQLIDAVDGSIVSADLADDAVTAAKLASNAVVNASVDASAAIAGTKISPNFGSQNIVTTGNAGIGTTSPSSELHVSALGASDEPTIRLASENSTIFLRTAGSSGAFPTGSGGDDGELTYIGGNFRLGVGTASKNLIFFNGSGYTERMRIDSAGRILIGTTSTVIGSSSEFNEIVLSGKTRGSGITLQDVDANTRFQIRTDDNGDGVLLNASTNDLIAIRTNNTERIRITSAGAVGIGTTSPDVKLDVARLGSAWTGQDPIAGTVAHLHNGNNGSSSAVYLGLGGGTASFSGINFGDADDADVGRITYGHSDNSLSFNVNASERFRITSTGAVGIGTTSPDGKLHLLTGGTTDEAHVTLHASATTGTSNSGEVLKVISARGTGNTNPIFNVLTNTSTSVFAVTGDQKVGINTTSPSQLMELASTAPNIRLTDTVDGHSEIDGNSASLKFNADKGNAKSSTTITFFVDNSEKVRINSNGHLLINNTSASLSIGDSGAILAGSNGIHTVARNASTGAAVFWVKGGSGQAYFLGDGDLLNTNDSYGGISDQELKENIVDANSQWNDIKALKIRNYNFKESTGYNTHKQIGVVAQELEASGMNGLVKNIQDELYVEGDELPEGKNVGDVKEKGYKAVKYSVLHMKAIKALQESMAKIETLETKVAALEAA